MEEFEKDMNPVEPLENEEIIEEKQVENEKINEIIEETTQSVSMENEDILEESIEEPSEEQTFEPSEEAGYNGFGTNSYVPNFTYSEPRPEKIKNKGLRVFCLILALVLIVSLSLCVGYFAGINKNGGKISSVSGVSANLESRPDSDVGLAKNYSEALSKVEKSVVNILVYNDSNSASGIASGVIYSKDGYIVTNDHIYDSIPKAKFLVRLYNGEEYKASFVAGDVRSDLAVIKLDEKVKDLVPAKFGNSNDVIVGESVIAVGYTSSYGDSVTLTGGIISAVNRRVTSTTTNYASSFLQTDATINPGNSGGALSNMYGQVIGITSSKLAGDEYDAVSYAIPTTTMEKVVKSLIEKGCVDNRAKLGITYTEINSVMSENEKTPVGVYIASISEDSDLYGKGFGEGDIITHVNGVEIISKNVLLDVIDNTNANETIRLEIYMSNKKTSKEIDVKLKADKGSSSYSTKESSNSQNDSILDIPDNYDDDKIFDFPLD